MKITCPRDRLAAAFQTAAAVAPSRSPKLILMNVRMEVTPQRAVLVATDLEAGIRVEVPGIEVEAPGAVVLPIDRFGAILRESTDEKIRLESDGRTTTVRGERSVFHLPAENPDEFPVVTSFSGEKFHELPARLLREMIRRTVFATDNESTRYALGGVKLEFAAERLTAVATDGRRLAKMEGPCQAHGGHAPTGDIIIPSRSASLIERAISDSDGEVQLLARENDLLVHGPRTTVYTRLVEGRFPRWRDVLPFRTNSTKIEMTVGPLHAAVRQAMIVTSEDSRGVDFQFADGTLVLSARAAESGQSRVELPVAYDGTPVEIMLDPRFVSDFLRVLDTDRTVTWDIADADQAALLSTDDGYAYVIMPLARERT
jgi:DNA polymerase-3 subunit beta